MQNYNQKLDYQGVKNMLNLKVPNDMFDSLL